MTKINAARMPEESMNLIERLCAAALKEALSDHKTDNPATIVSSIAKRLSGKLRGAFLMTPKGDGSLGDDPAALQARIIQLESNFANLSREHERVSKKKRQQDQRIRVALECLDKMADEGIEQAHWITVRVREIKDE